MNAHTEQVIYQNGQPAFVVISYDDYVENYRKEATDKGDYIPQAVVDLMFNNDCSLLKAWRLSKGLSQTKLAEMAGLKQSAIARLESEAHTPTSATLDKLAQALGIKPQQLILD